MKLQAPTPYLVPSLALLAQLASAAPESPRPNIVLINIDDLGWTDLSCQGSSYYETPHIDQLKSEGIFFNNGYTAAANSAPSRASMLTGCYSPRHGVFTVMNSDRGKSSTRKLIPAENTKFPSDKYPLLPQVMQKNGYNTCHIGKWHVGEDPEKQGIDLNIAGTEQGHPASYFSPYKNPKLKDGPKGEYLCDRLAEEALTFLKETRDKTKPFFLYYAPYAVHTPLQAKEELIKKYKSKASTEAHHNPVYAGLVESMDTNVGKVLDYLKESGLEDNTLIILTSDNGGVYDISKQWPLRAGKGSFYEGGFRVPVIIKWPQHTKAGFINETPVINIDFYPTILAAAGISTSGLKLDGANLLPLLDGTTPRRERSLYWHFPAYLEGGNEETTDKVFRSRPVSVIRQGDWKLIYNYESEKMELYNLKTDISEKHNLVAEEEGKAKSLMRDLDRWLKTTRAYTRFKENPEYQGS